MQDLASMGDESLVELAKARGARDDRPFALLYERHQGMVWSVCYRYLGNAQDAEDVMQDVFVRAHAGLKGFAGRSSFRTWLYQIAINSCHNEYRRQRRRPAITDVPVEEIGLTDPGGETRFDGGALRGIVLEALSALPEADRDILLLREFEGLSYEEIAQRLGLQMSATRMRLRRARIAFTRAVQELQGEADD
jgi:RNA polymerase sigma-70 factor (ECF subfamily)